MSSPEYHKCMSEEHFTRALQWAIVAAYICKNATQSYEMWLVVASAIFAVSNLICSNIEARSTK